MNPPPPVTTVSPSLRSSAVQKVGEVGFVMSHLPLFGWLGSANRANCIQLLPWTHGLRFRQHSPRHPAGESLSCHKICETIPSGLAMSPDLLPVDINVGEIP